MFIYLIILFILFILALINPFIRNKISFVTKVYCLEFLILFILGGIRKDVGVDYVNYEELYSMGYKLYEMKEKGFIWIIEVFNKLDFPFFIFCMFFIGGTLLGIFRFIVKYSPYIFLSTLIYYSLGNFYFSSFNATRQVLATAIFLNLLDFVKEKKIISYSLYLIFVAYFIHASAIILIPLYFFLYKKWNWTYKLIMFTIIVIFSSYIFELILNSPYSFYVKNEDFASSVPLTYYFITIFSIYTLIYSYYKPDFENRNLILVNINFVTIIFLYLIFAYNGTVMVIMLSRVLGYFTPIYIVLIPILIYEYRLNINRYIYIFILSFILVFLSFWAIYKNGVNNKLIPYNTILTDYI